MLINNVYNFVENDLTPNFLTRQRLASHVRHLAYYIGTHCAAHKTGRLYLSTLVRSQKDGKPYA